MRAWWAGKRGPVHWFDVASNTPACGGNAAPAISDLRPHAGNHWSRWRGWKVCGSCRQLDPNR